MSIGCERYINKVIIIIIIIIIFFWQILPINFYTHIKIARVSMGVIPQFRQSLQANLLVGLSRIKELQWCGPGEKQFSPLALSLPSSLITGSYVCYFNDDVYNKFKFPPNSRSNHNIFCLDEQYCEILFKM